MNTNFMTVQPMSINMVALQKLVKFRDGGLGD
jgi:hypothetical protein